MFLVLKSIIDDSLASSSNSSISSEDNTDNSVNLDILSDSTLADNIPETSSESDVNVYLNQLVIMKIIIIIVTCQYITQMLTVF